MALSGLLYLNDRDAYTDFGFVLAEFSGWPGTLSASPLDVPLLDGPEIQGAIIDPRLIRRRPGTGRIVGTIRLASTAAALAALDSLRGLVYSGVELAVRSIYAPDRQCFAVCTDFNGGLEVAGSIDGNVVVAMTFSVRNGLAERIVPDGYALSTTRVACPQWTAESRPVIVVHGGGAALTNPVVTMRSAGGDPVQSVGFTVSLGANDALRIDCARGLVSKIASGTVSDALAAGYWTSGDFGLVFRPMIDGNPEVGAYPSLELSASSGTPVGRVTYTRRAA
jgi:hypothetical protein